MKKLIVLFICFSFTLFANQEYYTCGVADKYPPYQFMTEENMSTGYDVDIINLIFNRMNKEIIIEQGKWDDMVDLLKNGSKLDLISGMEITDIRKKWFDFTLPYYRREIVIFVKSENNTIKKIDDLIGKTVAGDRNSYIENELKKRKIIGKVDIIYTDSKEESMLGLENGEFEAVIAPKAVGRFLAKKYNFKVKAIEGIDPGTPVAVAVKKGNQELVNEINRIIKELRFSGEIEKKYDEWFEY